MNFPNFPDELSEFHSTFLIFPNFPDELSEFSGWTVRILLNFPNLSSQNRWGPLFFLLGLTPRTFQILLNFPKFSEFSGQTFRIFPNFPNFSGFSGWTFRIFHPKIGEDLFFLFFFFFFRSHPLELSEFVSTFRIFQTNFPNFDQVSKFFPNF